MCHKHKLAGMVHVGHVLQLFGCSLNPSANAYELKSVITVQVFSIPFFSSEQFVQCASCMNLLAYLPYNIPEASFKLFNLHTSTLRYKVIEQVTFQGDTIPICLLAYSNVMIGRNIELFQDVVLCVCFQSIVYRFMGDMQFMYKLLGHNADFLWDTYKCIY